MRDSNSNAQSGYELDILLFKMAYGPFSEPALLTLEELEETTLHLSTDANKSKEILELVHFLKNETPSRDRDRIARIEAILREIDPFGYFVFYEAVNKLDFE